MIDKHAPHHQAQPLSKLVVCGDCDHGEWSSATGNITAPGAVVIPLRGVAPADTGIYERSSGDSINVHVPGNPPVSRTPEQLAADAAAGRTWLDYGILAGGNRRLYGHALGPRTWVYCAADGSRWHCALSGPSLPTITFKEFGRVPGSNTGPVQFAAVAVESPIERGEYFPRYFVIDDVNSDGSEIIVCTGYHWTMGMDLGVTAAHRWSYYLYRVAISGTPPAAVVTLTLVSDSVFGSMGYQYNNNYESYGVHALRNDSTSEMLYVAATPDYVQPAGYSALAFFSLPINTASGWDEWTIGGCYVANVFTPVVLRKEYVVSETYTYLPITTPDSGIEYQGTFSAEVALQITIGSQVLRSVITDSSPYSGIRTVSGLGDQTNAVSDGTALVDGVLSISAPLTVSSGNYTSISGWPASIGHHEVMPCRCGNRAWSLCLLNYGDIAPAYGGYSDPNFRGGGGNTHLGYVSPSEVIVTRQALPLSIVGASVSGYASAHPVTGSIVWSFDGPVCWV